MSISLLTMGLVPRPTGGGGAISATWLGTPTDFGTSTSSVGSINFGTAAADRLIVAFPDSRGSATPLSAMTIGGISATQAALATSDSLNFRSAAWVAAVPTGTSGTVGITFGTRNWCHIGFWAVYGASSTILDFSEIASTATPSDTLTTVSGGLVLASCVSNPTGGSVVSWTNLTEDFEGNTTSDDDTISYASDLTSGSSLAITATTTGNSLYTAMSAVSLQPA